MIYEYLSHLFAPGHPIGRASDTQTLLLSGRRLESGPLGKNGMNANVGMRQPSRRVFVSLAGLRTH